MELIKPTDELYFTVSSTEPYDRHRYMVVFKDKKTVNFDNWEDTQRYWWEWCQTGSLSHIEVLEKSQKKSNGFK